MNKQIIIIGGGPAGLTAAYQILKTTDYTPVIIEQSDDFGGIAKTVEYHGNHMDLGGHRFFSKDGSVLNLWNEWMPLESPSYKAQNNEHVMMTRHRISRIFYRKHFFDYPISLKPATFINMGFISTMKAGFGYLISLIHKREENSLEDFYINRFGAPLYHMFFENYTEKVWGIHPSKISPDWGSQRVKGLSILKAIKNALGFKKNQETSLIDSFSYPKLGPGQMWTSLAKDIQSMGGIIHTGQTVTKISVDQYVTSITATKENGHKCIYTGDYFLSSMPIKDLLASMEHVPSSITKISDALPYRDFITVGLLVSQFANNADIADCWIYVQEPDVKLGRLQIFNNWSPYMVNDNDNTKWLGLEYFCNEGDADWCKTDSEFISFAQSELSKIGLIREEDVLDATCIHVKKAYPAYFGSYQDFPKIQKYLDQYSNLYCIGRNGQHRYNNMDHSMLTAIKAVEQIKNHTTTDHSAVWDVNTEESYHEGKS